MENDVIYNPERHSYEMLLGVSRHKGCTGVVKLTWGVSIKPNAPTSFIVSPMFGVLEFSEGQWNSSFHLKFPFLPATNENIEIFVKLLNVSGGAILGNFTTVKITFPSNKVNLPVENNISDKNFTLKIVLSYSGSALLIIGLVIVVALLCRRHKKR